MDFHLSMARSVIGLLLLICMGTLLRRTGLLKEAHGDILTRIITHVTLPAMIFAAVSMTPFEPGKLLLAVVMIVAQLSCALLGWLVARLTHMNRPQTGALVMGATFTSSGFLGYAVIKQVFGADKLALSDAAVASELGVAIIIFTLGIGIAMHYGGKGKVHGKKEMLRFFYSPIFLSLVLGIGVSFIKLPQNMVVDILYTVLHTTGAANTLLVTVTIGLMLHFRHFRRILPVIALICIIKLVVQPLLAFGQAQVLHFPQLWQQIVVIEAAMPTAALSAVFAKRYGCDSELSAILVLATFFTSILTMLVMTVLLG